MQNYTFALYFAPMSGSNSDVAPGVFLALHSLLLRERESGNFWSLNQSLLSAHTMFYSTAISISLLTVT